MGSTLTWCILMLPRLLQLSIMTTAVVISIFILDDPLPDVLKPLPAFLSALGLNFLAICIHEGGHYLGAKWARMTVLFVRLMAIEITPLKRGWRLRWAPAPKGCSFAGYVMMAANPRHPFREAYMLCIAMGPLMNLAVGGLSLALTLLLDGPSGSVALCFAILNIAHGLANLLPTYLGSVSDGAQLLAWWCRPDEQGERLAGARLLSMTIAGATSLQLPAADIEHLNNQALRERLLALRYRLDALQLQGHWGCAVSLSETLDQILHDRPHEQAHNAGLVSILRKELEFCRALRFSNAQELHEGLYNKDIDWYAPTLMLRCQALRAALKGERARCDDYLQQVAGIADNAMDLSLAKREQVLAGYITALS
ncbi:hypothetical protein PS3A_61340 [Pseudomonas sp. 3A(2025)]